MRLVAISCILIGLSIIGLSQGIDDLGTNTIYGPRFWPVAVSVVLIVLNIPAAVRPITPPHPPSDIDVRLPEDPINKLEWRLLLPAYSILFTYPFAVSFIGFPLASIVFYLSLMLALGQRNRLLILVVGICFPLLLSFFFTRVAYMPLPKGSGAFEDVTIWIYRAIGAY